MELGHVVETNNLIESILKIKKILNSFKNKISNFNDAINKEEIINNLYNDLTGISMDMKRGRKID